MSERSEPAVTVLVIEDEASLRDLYGRLLRLENYDVRFAADGEEGLRLALTTGADLIFLNLGLPKMHGLEVLRAMRSQGCHTPVLVVSGHSTLHDRVTCFEAGADDFVGKPFEWEEVVARSRALVRRSRPQGDIILRVGDLTVNETARSASRGGKPVTLSPIEFRLLTYLMRMSGIVVTTRMVARAVWGQSYPEHSRRYGNAVAILRRKIQGKGLGPPLLFTIPGVGFVLDPTYDDTPLPR
jgi:DNA-binding response OmpR family regulator